jgi:hypothetical protein
LKFNLKSIVTLNSFTSVSHSISIPSKLNFKFLSWTMFYKRAPQNQFWVPILFKSF